jgi:hypothetical protein
VSTELVATTLAPETMMPASVSFWMVIYIFDLFDRLVAVYRRVDQCVVEIEHRLLSPLVPGAGVVGELTVELRIRTERVEEGGLVVGLRPIQPYEIRAQAAMASR